MRPRSTDGILYTDRVGFDLAKVGKKICTSRYGIRTELAQGDIVTFKCNDGSDDSFQIEILFVNTMELALVGEHEAWAISNYGFQAMYDNFKEIYESLGKVVTPETDITLVWFKRI